MGQRVRWCIMLIMTILLLGSSFSYVQVQGKEQKQVILILINHLSFTDKNTYAKLPGFKGLESNGIKGAMNINSGGNRNEGNSYLSIGGGSHGIGTSQMGDSFLMKKSINKDNQIYFQDINDLLRVEQKFPFKIGALGETLKQNHLISKVYGNNDIDRKVRYAPLITMDENGITYGDVGENVLEKYNSRPFHIRTNYHYLNTQLEQEINNGTALVVLDLGDLYRIDKVKKNMTDVEKENIRMITLKEIGEFVDNVLSSLKDNQTLIVASPMVGDEAKRKGYLLAPIWIYNKNLSGNILSSGTTRRDGIITNIDLAPTILSMLNVEEHPKEMIGTKIKGVYSYIKLDEEIKHISSIFNLRASVLYPYVMWQIIIMLISIFIWIKNAKRITQWIAVLLLSLLYLPLLLLYTSFWTPNTHIIYLGFILVSSIILGWLTNKLKPAFNFLIIGFVTFSSISIDILLGGELMKRSFLGYDPIIGARYYGIGNEYMGVYLGAVILFTSTLLQLRKNKFNYLLTAISYGLVIIILMLPILGTNFGGAISAIVALGITYFYLINIKWNKNRILLYTLVLVAGIGLVVVFNYYAPAEKQSHIGRALNQLFSGDMDTIFQTIKRKLSMNWKLLQVSSWGRIVITSIFVISLLSLKNSFKKLRNQYLDLFKGFLGIIIGAFVSLIVNDSGVVAAATMIIYVAVPILYLALIKQQES